MSIKFNSIVVGLVLAGSSQLVAAQDLLQTYQLALTKDPTVLQAEAIFKSTEESIEQARSALLPQINATAGYTMDTTDNPMVETDTDTTSFALNLSMSVYNHSSWLTLDASKKAAHRSDINYQFSKQLLISRVTGAYFNVLAANDSLEFAVAEKNAIERQLEQTKQRFSVGLTAITDVHEAQAQYDNSVAAEIAAQNNVYNAEEALREITGVYPENLNVLNTDRFSPFMPTPANIDHWEDTAVAKNLQLIGERIAMDIAKDQIDIATSGHLPTLSLSGSVSSSDSDFEYDNGDPDVNGYDVDQNRIGIQLNVPIYEGGFTSSTVRQAQHDYAAASQGMQLVYRGVVRDSRNSYNSIVATISGVKAFEQAVISAESALKATEAGFEVGTRTIVDVLDSTRNLYNAKRNLSTTRYQYINNMLALKAATGTISDEDIVAINNGLSAK